MYRQFLIYSLFLVFVACDSADSDEQELIVSAPLPDHYITLKAGPLSMSLDPLLGGRIASFRHEGQEILQTKRDANNFAWGSTIWPSPQSDWNWPPPAVFDSEPYSVSQSKNDTTKVVLISGIQRETGLQVIKTIRLAIDEGRGPLATLRYRIYNRGNTPQKVAIWENTRVPWGGYVSFPSGGETRFSKDHPVQLTELPDQQLTQIGFDAQQPDEQKIFYTPLRPAGDRPRLSHTYHYQGLVFEKSWRYPGVIAPEQAPIEIYLAPSKGFAELELQGNYVTVPKGGHLEFTVFWRLFPAAE